VGVKRKFRGEKMKWSLVNAAAATSLAVFVMVDGGVAQSAEVCSFSERTSVFGGQCVDAANFRSDRETDLAPAALTAAVAPGVEDPEVEEPGVD
jgi:hypothetical protein